MAATPATTSGSLPTLQPTRLGAGKRVALVAPAFGFDATLMEQGRGFLESHFNVKTCVADNVHEQHAYFAGTDERRLEEIYYWLTHPEAHALLAIRGGYGCARFYPELISRLRATRNLKPKIVAGYSDLTILLNGLYQDLGWVTFHAPVIVGRPFRTPLPIEESTFHKSLFTREPLGAITDEQTIVLHPGTAQGPMVGGCLSLLVSTLGTSYEIQTDDKILFMEDVDEKPYRLDRMLTQLVHAGKFDKVRGVVFGQMLNCEPGENSRDPSRTSAVEAIKLALGRVMVKRSIPVIYNFPAGHGMPQITFPIGARVEVRAKLPIPEVVFLEPGVK